MWTWVVSLFVQKSTLGSAGSVWQSWMMLLDCTVLVTGINGYRLYVLIRGSTKTVGFRRQSTLQIGYSLFKTRLYLNGESRFDPNYNF